MKKLTILSTCAMLLLVQAAAAQDYFIRVANNTNLRESYSLESDILETARAGTVLQVIGAFKRWLKIERPGGAAWMAKWVSYSRVEDKGDQAPPAQIDNCCFVDRQCNSDQDWTAGYWAFQNNQCPSLSHSGQQSPQPLSDGEAVSSKPPTSAVQAPVDNCCQINRECKSESDWQMGFWAFARGQCHVRHQHIDGILVEGSSAFANRVREALDVLRTRAPNWHAYAINGLDTIRQVSENTGVGVDTAQRRFDLTPSHAFLDHGNWSTDDAIIWLAGVFVHEACHVYRHEAGFPYTEPAIRYREEAVCQQVQLDALTTFDPQRRFNVYLRGLIEEFIRRGQRV